jgi:type II secretory pathway pseudopilin PulG
MFSVRRAFTLLELIVVIATLLLLAALCTPVFLKVRAEAARANSISQMRQIGIALSLYRGEYEGAGGDSMSGLGMPPSFLALGKWAKFPEKLWDTGGPPPAPNVPPRYTWIVPAPNEDNARPSWAEYVAKDGEQAVPLLDETQGNEMDARFHPFVVHRILGLHLDGHVESRAGFGDYTNYGFWDPAL